MRHAQHLTRDGDSLGAGVGAGLEAGTRAGGAVVVATGYRYRDQGGDGVDGQEARGGLDACGFAHSARGGGKAGADGGGLEGGGGGGEHGRYACGDAHSKPDHQNSMLSHQFEV